MTYNWNAKGKCRELRNFKMEINNIFLTYSYKISDAEKVPIIKNWLGREDLYFTQTLTKPEQEPCGPIEGVIEIFSKVQTIITKPFSAFSIVN